MNSKNKIFLIFFLLGLYPALAQEGTRLTKDNSRAPVGRIMIIPFEPKLYMSEIDRKINEKTKWNFEQIRENFRHQLENQLKLKLKPIGKVVSFYTDSAKMSKDLLTIYKSTALSYELIETPKVPAATTEEGGITKGQLTVEVNTDKKFMNLKINDSNLLTSLHKKYKTEYFVFINQLDIKNDMDSYDIATDTYQREITVHYSTFNKEGKNILAGIATTRFSSKESEPKKIVSLQFSIIASKITARFVAAVTPEPSPTIR